MKITKGMIKEIIKEEIDNYDPNSYSKRLAQKLIAQKLVSPQSSEQDILDKARALASKELGVKTANFLFSFDEDFPSEVISYVKSAR